MFGKPNWMDEMKRGRLNGRRDDLEFLCSAYNCNIFFGKVK